MEYNDLLNLNDIELTCLINRTMGIYEYIKDDNLKYKMYEPNNLLYLFKKKIMSDNDKKCFALFLAGLQESQDIYDIFLRNSDITLDKIKKYFKLPKNEYILSYIGGDTEKYYNENFYLFFSKIIRNISEENKKINTENIFNSIKDDDICSSDIIKNIFKYFGIESRHVFRFEHVIFDEIEELGIQKSINTYKEKEITKTNNIQRKKKSQNYNDAIKYGIDLTELEYDTNPALGRDKEIDEIMASLLIGNSVILTGDAATGKTAIVEGLAYKIQNKNIHDILKNKKIIKINSSKLISGTRYRGEFEEKIEHLIECFINDPDLIMFIDEMHTVIGAGSAREESLDLANMLKPYLDRGQIKMIGATTTEEYEKYISNDSAFKRRFERIKVNELDNNVIKEILKDVIYKMEKTTKIKFNLDKNKILDLIIELTQNKYRVYNDKINNPDISIKILKKAFAYAMLENNEEVKINNIQKAIENCDRIYDSVRTRYNNQLENIDTKKVDNKPKVIEMVRK